MRGEKKREAEVGVLVRSYCCLVKQTLLVCVMYVFVCRGGDGIVGIVKWKVKIRKGRKREKGKQRGIKKLNKKKKIELPRAKPWNQKSLVT